MASNFNLCCVSWRGDEALRGFYRCGLLRRRAQAFRARFPARWLTKPEPWESMCWRLPAS